LEWGEIFDAGKKIDGEFSELGTERSCASAWFFFAALKD
jgi:hypothetical protein